MERKAVVIGIGEVFDRPQDLMKSKEPLTLMADAVKKAATPFPELLKRADTVEVVKEACWPYLDLPRSLSDLLGIKPKRAYYGQGSGHGPVVHVHDSALRIARGEADIVVIAGAEAQNSVDRAAKAKIKLPWTQEDAPATVMFGVRPHSNPVAVKYGLVAPLHIYPLYENAIAAAWNQTPKEAQAESAEMWSRFSAVAAKRKIGWLSRFFTPDEVGTPSVENRRVTWPYTKYMVANPSVNMGAAILMTEYGIAKAAGIPDSRMVYVHGGASALEALDYVARDRFDSSPALNAVFQAVLDQMKWKESHFDFMDLYSCYPCVPKMAKRVLKFSDDFIPTVTGGNSFLGSPLHNYSTHAIVAMIEILRDNPGKTGLVYGQGGHVTKHHAIVMSTDRPKTSLPEAYSVQHIADQNRGPIPPLLDSYVGPADIETFSVNFDRNGMASYGIVVGRTPSGQRVLARVDGSDAATIAFLTNVDRSPVGSHGRTVPGADNLNYWETVA